MLAVWRQRPVDPSVPDLLRAEPPFAVAVDGPINDRPADPPTRRPADYDATRTASLRGLGYHVLRRSSDTALTDLPMTLAGITAAARLPSVWHDADVG